MHLHRYDGRGGKVRLEKISCEPPDSVKKDHAKDRFEKLDEELFDLQDLMWGARTHSLVMRSKSGTVRTLQATHSLEKLAAVAGERYH